MKRSLSILASLVIVLLMIEGRVHAEGCNNGVLNQAPANCASGSIPTSICYLFGGNPLYFCHTSYGSCISVAGTQITYTEANTVYDIIDCAPPPCHGCGSCEGCRPVGCQSPVVIDLLNEGIHFTNLKKGVVFDFNGDGKPLFMSWTDPAYHNAWLALDAIITERLTTRRSYLAIRQNHRYQAAMENGTAGLRLPFTTNQRVAVMETV